jgi:hypothetical protein
VGHRGVLDVVEKNKYSIALCRNYIQVIQPITRHSNNGKL